ncbi:potassium channel family protein [Ruminococcus sp.]
MRNSSKKEKLYAVIGLGRFGFALAKRLAESGKDLIVIDQSETVINDAVAFTDNAYLMTDLSKENLRNVGIQNCDTVIIGIGGDLAVSILTTMIVLQLGVPHVIAKALTEEHGNVLEKIGAEVVYPEREMGIRLANRLLAPRVMEYIALNDDISITEISIPESAQEMTVQEMNVRQRYGLNIIALKRGEEVTVNITPQTVLRAPDILAVVGRHDQVNRFENDLQNRKIKKA